MRLTRRGTHMNGATDNLEEPQVIQQTQVNIKTEPAFTLFLELPIELPLIIWETCLSGLRVLTHDSKYNRDLALLAVSAESETLSIQNICAFLVPNQSSLNWLCQLSMSTPILILLSEISLDPQLA
jgi:hypothetical protein